MSENLEYVTNAAGDLADELGHHLFDHDFNWASDGCYRHIDGRVTVSCSVNGYNIVQCHEPEKIVIHQPLDTSPEIVAHVAGALARAETPEKAEVREQDFHCCHAHINQWALDVLEEVTGQRPTDEVFDGDCEAIFVGEDREIVRKGDTVEAVITGRAVTFRAAKS